MILVPPRAPNGAALIAESNGHEQPASVYLAVKRTGVHWEPQPMPPAWRDALLSLGLNVPVVAP